MVKRKCPLAIAKAGMTKTFDASTSAFIQRREVDADKAAALIALADCVERIRLLQDLVGVIFGVLLSADSRDARRRRCPSSCACWPTRPTRRYEADVRRIDASARRSASDRRCASQVLRCRNSVGFSMQLPMRTQTLSMPCLSQYMRAMPSPHILLRP